jgi:transposase-like protein
MSEKSADVVPELVVKRGANGRCTYSVVAKRALAQLCQRPGVSVARLALTHGVNANLLRKWMNEFGEVQATVPEAAPSKIAGPALLQVTTTSAPRTPMSAPSFIEMEFAAARIRVHGAVDARALGVVLDCLAQRA